MTTRSLHFLLCALLAVVVARAPAATADDWLIRGWQTEHGLPQNAITALLQARGGYLWIGTFNGLARFDGAQFTAFTPGNTPALRSGRVKCLFEDARGSLWVGMETGDLARYENGAWHAVPLPSGWPGGSIRALQADASGALWLLHPTGLLLRLDDGYVIPASRPGKYIAEAALVLDAEGTLWLLRDQRLASLHAGALLPWTPPGLPAATPVLAVTPSASGGLWLGIGGRVRHWRATGWAADLGPISWSADDPLFAMQELAGGQVVAGTLKSGLHCYSAGAQPQTIGFREGLAHDWVRRVLEDREGNLWVGTAGGLNRLSLRRATMTPDRWHGAQVRAVAADAVGDLWIGSEGAGLHHVRTSGFTDGNRADGLPDSFIWSALPDRQGRVWAGTWGQGLFLRGDDGAFAPAPGWRADATIVTALYETRDGALWVGSDLGLACWAGGKWSWIKKVPGHVRTIVEDAAGALWCGTSGGGLACLRAGELTVFRREDGLASDVVWALDAEPDGSVWIGTSGAGLCRWKDGRFSQVTTAQGLPSDVICHFEEDGDDYWISSSAGIFRVSKDALRRCADGTEKTLTCLVLTQSDGLATLECSGGFQPAGTRTPDGRLWFPTTKGVVVIDPARIVPRTIPPPVIIESALVDDRAPAGRALVVPPGRHRVEFRYTGLCFAAPERVRFRHRLLKLDSDWTEAGALRSATYNYLPPGRYTFQVLACNGDGVWSPEPASVSFVVQPQFWQTSWFRIAAAGAVALLLVGAYRLRMRQLGEIQRVRFRIARDLHDEVGANLGSIALLSQVLEQQPNAADAGEVRRIATRTVEMLREIVWLTNPAHDRLSELLPRMREATRQMLTGIPYEFVADALPAELILPPAWRHHLLPIFKEALHNAARHGHPKHVRIVLRTDRHELELRIEDDGAGFDPATAEAGDGLLNLHRRARDMGAALDISSQPGAGTTVRLRVAIP